MTEIKKHSLKAWLLAARPKTLTGAAVPVMIGSAFAYTDAQENIRFVPLILCFLFAFIMQIDANFINDYFDFIKGNDDETRLGPERACAKGWIDAPVIKKAMIYTTLSGGVVGLPLVYYGGWMTILVGLLCMVFAFLYTTSLSYRGLGDVLVLVFFGFIPVCMTYYLVMPSHLPQFSWETVYAALLCGLVIDNLLIVNNYRDIDNDRRVGKRTLIVRLGAERGRDLYWATGMLIALSGFVFILTHRTWAAILPLLYVYLHLKTYHRMVKINQGRELNLILGETARNIFIYGLTLSAGLLLSFYLA